MDWPSGTEFEGLSVIKSPKRRRAHNFISERKWVNVAAAIFLGLTLVAVVVVVWQRINNPIAQGDYEGTIVDRWADYSESDQGAKPFFRLRVESQDGKRFTVKVDPNVYESARVGMRIKSRSGQVVLIDSTERTPGK